MDKDGYEKHLEGLAEAENLLYEGWKVCRQTNLLFTQGSRDSVIVQFMVYLACKVTFYA